MWVSIGIGNGLVPGSTKSLKQNTELPVIWDAVWCFEYFEKKKIMLLGVFNPYDPICFLNLY